MISSEIKLRVLYAHTDVMGIMNNARYLEYFEAGRNTLLREMGYPYTELEKNNYALPVIEAHAEYISTAKYDDIITVKAFLRSMPTARIKLEYELYIEGRLLAKGYTVHAFINLETLKPVKPPTSFINHLKTKLGT